jgi:hypothetical protein
MNLYCLILHSIKEPSYYKNKLFALFEAFDINWFWPLTVEAGVVQMRSRGPRAVLGRFLGPNVREANKRRVKFFPAGFVGCSI